jgi:hypothetical protein
MHFVIVEGENPFLGGDVILGVNEVQMQSGSSYDAIHASISKLKAEDNLTIRVYRQDQIVKLSIPTTR